MFKGVLEWTLKLEWTIILRWMRKGVCLPPDPARAEAYVGPLVAVGLVAVQKPVQVAAAMGTKHLPQGFVHFVSRLQCKQVLSMDFVCLACCVSAIYIFFWKFLSISSNCNEVNPIADFLAPFFHRQHHNFRRLKSSIWRPNWLCIVLLFSALVCEKSTLQIVLLAPVCNFIKIQIVLMALKLLAHNPNSTHGSVFSTQSPAYY